MFNKRLEIFDKLNKMPENKNTRKLDNQLSQEGERALISG